MKKSLASPVIVTDRCGYAYEIARTGPPDKPYIVTPLSDPVEPWEAWLVAPCVSEAQARENIELRYV